MATKATNDANARARLTVTATATSTGISWSASVTDNNTSFGGYAAAAGSWTIKVGSTTVATASGKSYDFGSGVISSPYFPRSASGDVALNPGTYSITGTFSGDGSTVGTATITAFNVTVVASTFTVTYSNANGANGTTTQTVTSGGTGTFPSPGARTGYSFDGWYDSATATYYSAGVATPAITAAKTFTSSWTAASYAISYANGGGTGTMSDTTWNYPNSGTVASNSFTRTGYTFAGWVNASGNAVAVGATYTTSVALTATWTGNTGTVYYNGNGNDGGSTANTTWTYPSTSGTVRANGFTRTGYTFARWNTAANGSGTDYFPGGSTPSDGTTLYAIWGVLAVYPSFTDTTVLTPATMGTAYVDGVSATNASSYSIISGALPGGLSFNTSTGAITGIPTAQGSFVFSVRATSSTANTIDSGSLTIVVYPPGNRPSTNTRLTTAKRLSGSTWVNLTVMKRFDGSNWVNITNT
jgi:uncharacterized repeat protein (TIGR02543 family)